MKLGIIIPEFPGQTHIFFWRELAALRGLGVEPQVVSTRRPPLGVVSHAWAQAAMTETIYLTPPSAADLAGALFEGLRGAPGGVARTVASMIRAEGLTRKGQIRLLGLALMGVHLARVAREAGWSHIHAHSCADSAHVALFAHLVSGIPYSVTLHGPLADYGPNQREKWRHAKFGIVITQLLLSEINERLAGSLPPVVDVVPMGVDVERFARRRPYAAWSGAGPLRIFSCGRLNPCKGHEDTLRAVALLRGRGIDARLEIAGEDELGGSGYHRELSAQIAAGGLDAAASLLGAVSEERVREGLEAAHAFVLASIAEPLGVAIMEAMALSVPVVATGSGGVPELVRPELDGVLVPPRSPAALADAIERVARDPALARRLGASARERVVARFDSGRSARVLAERAAA